MASTKCPECGRALIVTGLAPGAPLTCACGNVASAPSGIRKKPRYVFATIASVVLLSPCVIAIPNFIRFNVRAKQAECKSNLRAWHVAQRKHHAQHEAYSSSVGFSPERGNRYAYLGGVGAMEERGVARAVAAKDAVSVGVDTRYTNLRSISVEDLPREVASKLGVSGQCPDCAITAACAGNIDEDDTLDVWVVSTGELDLRDANGEPVSPGEPANIVNDVTD
ncbi:fimbrial protein [Pyxidicoccus fallax]|uniref:Fimbrial protein n=1 Tax=Pyxidicoccus fallax TaxID=394095 RepID=A0A848LID0_9BACT|nr:fimbrial protein [Pyxidicoccus fallax]NMO17456.1 fimbrial protein [Pyxidicoccus fallax]NPC82317.1 fimbrial protein [Pyxidicoccus fallax]